MGPILLALALWTVHFGDVCCSNKKGKPPLNSTHPSNVTYIIMLEEAKGIEITFNGTMQPNGSTPVASETTTMTTTTTTTVKPPEKPMETLAARRVTKAEFDELTNERVIVVEDPAFWLDAVDPRSNAFKNLHRYFDKLDAGSIILPNETEAIFSNGTDDADDDGLFGVESNPTGPKLGDGTNLGIYLVTAFLVAVCVFGLLAIVCYARANGKRTRNIAAPDARTARRQSDVSAVVGAGGDWRRSQDYLNNPEDPSASRMIEERSVDAADGSQRVEMRPVENDVTDV